MAGMFCNQCGHENPAGSRFCSSCGAKLAAHHDEHTLGFEPVPDETSPAVGADAEAVLAVTSGHRSGSRYAVAGDTVTVGRHPDSDVFLDDITVSRRHVELHRTSTGYAARDVGSLNGTYLNGARIEREAALTNGDELQIGKFKMLFLVTSSGM